MSDGEITLISQEGDKFTVPAEVAKQSKLVEMMLSEDADGDDEQDFPLPNVKTAVLAKVTEFMKEHARNPMDEITRPLRSSNMVDVVSEWYANFVNVEQDILFEIILAANYMDIKPLLDLTCAKVASLIKGKTPEQIREQFNIVNDFTPEEEQQVREENRWAEES